MLIDTVLNKKYNAILAEVRKGLGVSWSIRDYRTVMKHLDPFFPVVDGDIMSMKDVTQEQMTNHLSFIRMYSVRRGYEISGMDQQEVAEMRSIVITTRAFGCSKSEGHTLCRVVCSSCGGSSLRGLTDERFKEISSIEKGEHQEGYGVNSFKCIDCYKE